MAIFKAFGDLDDLGPPKQPHPDRQLPQLDTSNFKLETPPANCQPETVNCSLPPTAFSPQIAPIAADSELPTENCQLRTAN